MYKLLLTTLVMLVNCPDPAVRVAESLEACAKRLPSTQGAMVHCQCDPGLSVDYAVVLFPAREVTVQQIGTDIPLAVAQRAVANRMITDVDSLHVLPLGGAEPVTRTTSQANFVAIPQPLARVIRNPQFTLLLRRDGGQVIVEAIE